MKFEFDSKFKIRNSKLFLLAFLIFAFCIFLLPSKAKAGLVVQRPLYLGLTNGLVGYWSFDGQDMAGDKAYDRSGNNNTGTLTSGPKRSVGKVGQALSFDGSNDYVNAGSAAVLGNLSPMSVSAWIKPSSSGGTGVIVAKDWTGGWIFYFLKSGLGINTLAFQKNFTPDLRRHAANNTVSLDTWQHVVLTWDGSNNASGVLMYKNGAEVSSYASDQNGGGSAASDANLDFKIGMSNNGDPFNGLIDEVRIYNRALNADEIKRLYNIGATLKLNKPKYTDSLGSGLVGYWSFDGQDMAGTTAYDRSSDSNNGTLTGGPKRSVGKIGQSMEFDGSDDYGYTPKAFSQFISASVGTMAAWVRPTGLAFNDTFSYCGRLIVGDGLEGGGYAGLLRTIVGGADRIWAYNWDGTEDRVGITYNVNEWTHVVWVHSGGGLFAHKKRVLTGAPPNGHTP